jgi:hypothetical protein
VDEDGVWCECAIDLGVGRLHMQMCVSCPITYGQLKCIEPSPHPQEWPSQRNTYCPKAEILRNAESRQQ